MHLGASNRPAIAPHVEDAEMGNALWTLCWKICSTETSAWGYTHLDTGSTVQHLHGIVTPVFPYAAESVHTSPPGLHEFTAFSAGSFPTPYVRVVCPCRFGFVEYEDPEDSSAAIDNMHNAELYGRVLRVNYAQPMKIKGGDKGWSHQPVWADADKYMEELEAEQEFEKLEQEQQAKKQQQQQQAASRAGDAMEALEQSAGGS